MHGFVFVAIVPEDRVHRLGYPGEFEVAGFFAGKPRNRIYITIALSLSGTVCLVQPAGAIDIGNQLAATQSGQVPCLSFFQNTTQSCFFVLFARSG